MARSYSSSTQSINKAFQGMVASRYAASESNAHVGFFLTKEDDARFLVGLDLESGERVGAIPMKEKEPNFMVDAIAGRVYYFAGDSRVAAYDFATEDAAVVDNQPGS